MSQIPTLNGVLNSGGGGGSKPGSPTPYDRNGGQQSVNASFNSLLQQGEEKGGYGAKGSGPPSPEQKSLGGRGFEPVCICFK